MFSADIPKCMDIIDAKSGDLVNMRDGLGDVLAIRLPSQHPTYIVLTVNGKPAFVTGVLKVATECINYGRHWDIALDEIQPGWEKGDPVPGAMLIGAPGPGLFCGKSDDYRTPAIVYNLKTFAPASRVSYGGAWFRKWSLWWSPNKDLDSRRQLLKFDIGAR